MVLSVRLFGSNMAIKLNSNYLRKIFAIFLIFITFYEIYAFYNTNIRNKKSE